MPPTEIQESKTNYWRLLLVLLAVGALIILVKPQFFSDVFRVFSDTNKTELVENIKKEISNSGKLIFPDQNRNSFLTYQGVFDFTNEERKLLNLRPLSSNQQLNQVATRRLNDMFAKDYFEHVSPSGASASSEAELVGYEYISIGENIALGDFADDRELVTAWMNSPGHRANIVSTKFGELGVAVGRGNFEGRETWIAVQIFATPLDDCPQVSEENRLSIDNLNSRIEADKQRLEELQQELDQMPRNTQEEREEYNQKVGEFNELVRQTNERISLLKEMVSNYNANVRSFNACLEKYSN